MNKKEKLSHRVEFRLSKKDYYRLKTRAKLYSNNDMSELLRYWIENGPIPKKEKIDVTVNETKIGDS